MTDIFKVLLIEDDPVESQQLGSILDEGFIHFIKYSVKSEFENSELVKQLFDVIVIDIDTLGEDRPSYVELLQQIQSHNPDCLLMVLQSDSSEESIRSLVDLNIRKIVTKPYSTKEILQPIYQRIGMNFQDFQQRISYEHRVIDKKFIEIKDLVPARSNASSANQLFSKKLRQFSTIVTNHFLLEERHMSLYRYPDLDLHQQQHHSLLEDLKELHSSAGENVEPESEHAAILSRMENRLDHDHQFFIEFVDNLSHLNIVYAT